MIRKYVSKGGKTGSTHLHCLSHGNLSKVVPMENKTPAILDVTKLVAIYLGLPVMELPMPEPPEPGRVGTPNVLDFP
jgi:hypothetical protein